MDKEKFEVSINEMSFYKAVEDYLNMWEWIAILVDEAYKKDKELGNIVLNIDKNEKDDTQPIPETAVFINEKLHSFSLEEKRNIFALLGIYIKYLFRKEGNLKEIEYTFANDSFCEQLIIDKLKKARKECEQNIEDSNK